MNFKNQARVWEAEQRHLDSERRTAEVRAEAEAEEEYMKTVALLSTEAQEVYRQRQSVSFLYMKPPGYDAALGQGAQGAKGAGGGNAPAGAGPSSQQRPQQQQGGRAKQGGGINHVARVLGGVHAVVKQQLQLKRGMGGGGIGAGSPPRGGIDPSAENQRFVVAEVDSDEGKSAFCAGPCSVYLPAFP